DAGLAERAAERGHDAVAAVRDRGIDRVGIAAVQPIVVGQIREASRAARIRAVARRAVGGEKVLCGGHRGRIACERFEGLVLDEGKPRFQFLARDRDLLLVLIDLAPAANAGEVAEAGENREIYERE